MKKLIIFALTIICFAVIIFKLVNPNQNILQGSQLKTLQIGTQQLKVELAVTSEALSKGLGGRSVIGSDGMLFILPVRTVPTFWMKDMKFGLDFVWIDGNQIVALTPRVDAQIGARDQDLKIYSPQMNATEVLEIPSGEIDSRKLKVGDIVNLEK